jgi:putative transposase
VLSISKRKYRRWKKEPENGDQRKGPKSEPGNRLSEAERGLIVAVCNSPMFRDLSPAQIVPILADSGVYIASESSFYRVLRESKLLAYRSAARPAQHERPREYVATGANQVWSWDITFLKSPVCGMFYYLYLVVDVWSRAIVAWAVHEMESADLAREMIVSACREQGIDASKLVVHSDNGGPMKGATLLATFQFLGIVPSFSRPRVYDDNPYSESLFRTLKYRPEYPRQPFGSLEVAREWVEKFVSWYNHEHLHSGIRFVTPASRHDGHDQKILKKRKEVYEEARKCNPHRWTRNIRNWEPVTEVALNPVTNDPRRAVLMEKEG